MKICLFLFPFLFFASAGYAAKAQPGHGGEWQCEVQGEKGEGLLILDMEKKLIRLRPPSQGEITLPFSIASKKGTQLNLRVATGDKREHSMELDLFEPDNLRVTFVNEKDAPELRCSRQMKNSAGF